MNNISLTQRILASEKPFVFFHTHCVTKDLLLQAIKEEKSMDLDICVDDAGNPYIGHSREYYEKSDDPWDDTMPFEEVIDMISSANIPVMVDCKHFNAWRYVEEVIDRIGPERCKVNTFVSEFHFDNIHGEQDYISDWSPIEKLLLLKSNFSSITTTASAKFLPKDVLISDKHKELLQDIRQTLKDNCVDNICLNIPNNTVSDKSLEYFLAENIILQIGIDMIDTKQLSQIYIGETDDLKLASDSRFLK